MPSPSVLDPYFLDDLEFARLREFVRGLAQSDLQRQAPELCSWLLARLDQSRSPLDADGIADELQSRPLPTTFQRENLWRDLLTSFHELAAARDELIVTLWVLDQPVEGDVGRVVFQHEYEQFILKFDATVKLARQVIDLLCRRLLRPTSADWEDVRARCQARIQDLDATEVRDSIAHLLSPGLRAEDRAVWPLLALSDRQGGQPPALDGYRWFFEDPSTDVELLLRIGRGVNAPLEAGWRDLREELSAVREELPG